MVTRLLQSAKALPPMEVTEAGMVMLVIPHPEKAAGPMLAKELLGSKLMEVRFQQFWNAKNPMEVTEAGMVMLVRLKQPPPPKAWSPIVVTVGGMV